MGLPTFYFDSRLLDGTLAASSTERGFHLENLTDFRPYTFWKADPLQTGNNYSVTISDLPAGEQSADYLLIENHTLGEGTPEGTRVEIFADGTPVGFFVGGTPAQSITISDDKPVLLRFVSTESAASWEIRFSDPNPPMPQPPEVPRLVPAEIAILALGNEFQIPAGVREGFDPIGRSLEGKTNLSATGNPIGKIIEYQSWKQSLTFELLRWDWVRNEFLPAWQSHLKGTPFVFAWDPEDYPDELFLVNAGDSFTTPHRAGSITDLTVQVMGIAPQF